MPKVPVPTVSVSIGAFVREYSEILSLETTIVPARHLLPAFVEITLTNIELSYILERPCRSIMPSGPFIIVSVLSTICFVPSARVSMPPSASTLISCIADKRLI